MDSQEDLLKARILIIDDNPSIHQDFRKILAPSGEVSSELAALDAAVFGGPAKSIVRPSFEIDSAYQGQEGLEMLVRASQAGKAYTIAFVDVRMPPGWSGIETTIKLWDCHPDLQ